MACTIHVAGTSTARASLGNSLTQPHDRYMHAMLTHRVRLLDLFRGEHFPLHLQYRLPFSQSDISYCVDSEGSYFQGAAYKHPGDESTNSLCHIHQLCIYHFHRGKKVRKVLHWGCRSHQHSMMGSHETSKKAACRLSLT